MYRLRIGINMKTNRSSQSEKEKDLLEMLLEIRGAPSTFPIYKESMNRVTASLLAEDEKNLQNSVLLIMLQINNMPSPV